MLPRLNMFGFIVLKPRGLILSPIQMFPAPFSYHHRSNSTLPLSLLFTPPSQVLLSFIFVTQSFPLSGRPPRSPFPPSPDTSAGLHEEAAKLQEKKDSLPKQSAVTEQCGAVIDQIHELIHRNLITSLTHAILTAACAAKQGVDFRKALQEPQQRMRAAKVPATDFDDQIKTLYLQGLDMQLPS